MPAPPCWLFCIKPQVGSIQHTTGDELTGVTLLILVFWLSCNTLILIFFAADQLEISCVKSEILMALSACWIVFLCLCVIVWGVFSVFFSLCEYWKRWLLLQADINTNVQDETGAFYGVTSQWVCLCLSLLLPSPPPTPAFIQTHSHIHVHTPACMHTHTYACAHAHTYIHTRAHRNGWLGVKHQVTYFTSCLFYLPMLFCV